MFIFVDVGIIVVSVDRVGTCTSTTAGGRADRAGTVDGVMVVVMVVIVIVLGLVRTGDSRRTRLIRVGSVLRSSADGGSIGGTTKVESSRGSHGWSVGEGGERGYARSEKGPEDTRHLYAMAGRVSIS